MDTWLDEKKFVFSVRKAGPGRPRTPSVDAGKRTMKERAKKLLDSSSPITKKFAASITLEEVHPGISKVLNFAEENPKNISILNDFVNEKPRYFVPNTPIQALKLMIKTGLSKEGYRSIRKNAIALGASTLYPSYYQLNKEKSRCIPNSITCSETRIGLSTTESIKLTVERILSDPSKENLILNPKLIEFTVFDFLK